MVYFLVLAATAWMLMGLGVLSGSKSAIHEILGAVLMSFSVLFVGVAGIYHRLSDQGAQAKHSPPADVRRSVA